MLTRKLVALRPGDGANRSFTTIYLTDERPQRWLAAIDRLVASGHSGMRYMDRSYRIFTESLSSSRPPDYPIEISGSIMDWLSTMRTVLAFWDHQQPKLGRGEQYRAACVREYDSHFSYRFLYRLRNYAQHRALPIQLLNFVDGRWAPTLERETLLNRYDGWSTVRADLLDQPDQFPIEPLITDGMGSMRRINRVIREPEVSVRIAVMEAIEDARKFFAEEYDGAEPLVCLLPDDMSTVGAGSSVSMELTPSWAILAKLAEMWKESLDGDL